MGALVISEYSQEIAVLCDGPWRVSTPNTTSHAEGPPDFEALLERPLGALIRLTRLDRSLVYPEALHMRDGKRCVVIQMDNVLEIVEAKLEDIFDEIQPIWRDAPKSTESTLRCSITTRSKDVTNLQIGSTVAVCLSVSKVAMPSF